MEALTKEQKKHQKWYRTEFNLAKEILAPFGGEFHWTYHQYEAFKFNLAGASILFYPHKTKSTLNISVRVRDMSSKDKRLSELLMTYLDLCSPGVTFTRKNHHQSWTHKPEDVFQEILAILNK